MEQSEVRLLLDTHAWIWWMAGNPRLPLRARAAMSDLGNEVLVSAVSVYELMRKYRIGKLPEMAFVAQDVERAIDENGFQRHAITTLHAEAAASFEHDHRDPFDRLLIAQALTDDLTIVSNEALFDAFGVRRLWE